MLNVCLCNYVHEAGSVSISVELEALRLHIVETQITVCWVDEWKEGMKEGREEGKMGG